MDHRSTPPTARLVDLERFRAGAATWMAADPVATNVMATVSSGAGAATSPRAVWVLVESDGEVVGAAFRTPPYPLNLPPMPDAAAEAVARVLHARGVTPDQLSGDVRATRVFAELWARLTGARCTLGTELGIHVLGELVPPVDVPGIDRLATVDDAQLVAGWLADFHGEAHGEDRPRPDRAALERRLVDAPILLHEFGGRPVSLAGWHPPRAGVSRVGPVYTPVEHRRHGYAAAVTAAASRAALAAGAEHVMLFTDLANDTSNGVYARLGYRRVGDASEWTVVH